MRCRHMIYLSHLVGHNPDMGDPDCHGDRQSDLQNRGDNDIAGHTELGNVCRFDSFATRPSSQDFPS